MPKEISKIEAATMQLETAIKLFFEGRDFESTYTLSGASDGILQDLADKDRDQALSRRRQKNKPLKFSMKEELEILVKPEFHKEAFKLVKAPRNFLKHADFDPDQILEFDGPKQAQAQIMSAIHNYDFLMDQVTKPMEIFTWWLFVENPKLISKDADDRETMIQKIEAFQRIPKTERRQVFFEVLKANCPTLFS